MKGKFIMLGSVTYAMKAKEILFRNGIKAYSEKVKSKGSYGCGWGVRVQNGAEKALYILLKNGFKAEILREDGDE